jgi:hypothetical protein
MLEWTTQGQSRLATARAKHDDAITHIASHRSHDAAASLETAMRLRRSVLPPHHPVVIGTLELLATTKYRIGDTAGALELFKDLHTQQRDRFGEHHPEVEHTAVRVAEIMTELGQTRSAEGMYEAVWARRTADRHDELIADFEQLLSQLKLPEAIALQTGDDHMATMAAMQMHSYATSMGAASPGRGASDSVQSQVHQRMRDNAAAQRTAHPIGDVAGLMPTDMDPELQRLLAESQRPTAADHLLEHGVAPARTDGLEVDDAASPSPPPPPSRPTTADTDIPGPPSRDDDDDDEFVRPRKGEWVSGGDASRVEEL